MIRRFSACLCSCVVFSLLCLAACSDPSSDDNPFVLNDHATHTVVVIDEYPHDAQAFTQGLLWHDGLLYESTGLRGSSSVRAVDRDTGDVRQKVDLDAELFGEGLARVGDRLIQLTWQAETALVWNIDDLSAADSFTYQGEGWGLCHDGSALVMSNGSHELIFRDPISFAETGRRSVTHLDQPIDRLNELECTGDRVLANVWQTDLIVDIDTETGTLVRIIDASPLRDVLDSPSADVLNGSAVDGDRGHLLVTGKLWPTLFAVDVVPLP